MHIYDDIGEAYRRPFEGRQLVIIPFNMLILPYNMLIIPYNMLILFDYGPLFHLQSSLFSFFLSHPFPFLPFHLFNPVLLQSLICLPSSILFRSQSSNRVCGISKLDPEYQLLGPPKVGPPVCPGGQSTNCRC